MFHNTDEVAANVIADLRRRMGELESRDIYTRPTAGSVLFGGTNGVLAQDNTNFFWDDTNNVLKVASISLPSAGSLPLLSNLSISPGNSTDAAIELGFGNTGNRNTYIDFRADDTYTDYALRIIRNSTGANANTSIIHRGTGALQLVANDAGSVDVYTNNVVVGQFLSDGRSLHLINDAVTAATSNHLWYHRTSGTPATNFGTDWIILGDTNGGSDKTMMTDRTIWATAADATRKARRSIFVHDTAAREAIRMEASGTAAMIGFLGAAAVARPAVTGVRTGTLAQLQTVVANLLAAIAAGSLGLITDSTT